MTPSLKNSDANESQDEPTSDPLTRLAEEIGRILGKELAKAHSQLTTAPYDSESNRQNLPPSGP
jgi:hypothetical protein